MSSVEVDDVGAATVPRSIDLDATIAAWRERGDHRFDPVRFRFIEALARRAADHHGDARRILDDKLAKLLAAYGDAFEKASVADAKNAIQNVGLNANRIAHPGSAHGAARTAAPARQPPRGALAELVDHIAAQTSLHRDGNSASDATPGFFALGSTMPSELKSLSYFRSTWSKLSADRRLTQSLAKVPDNAGPLNSHHLVHRALTSMRDLSPEYLARFMSYVDALLWLDQANGGPLPGTDTPRAESHKKAARSR